MPGQYGYPTVMLSPAQTKMSCNPVCGSLAAAGEECGRDASEGAGRDGGCDAAGETNRNRPHRKAARAIPRGLGLRGGKATEPSCFGREQRKKEILTLLQTIRLCKRSRSHPSRPFGGRKGHPPGGAQSGSVGVPRACRTPETPVCAPCDARKSYSSAPWIPCGHPVRARGLRTAWRYNTNPFAGR